MTLKAVLSQMDEVAGEYYVCLVAIRRLRESIQRDPTLVAALNLSRTTIQKAVHRLDATFIIRAFALFEAALREIWKNSFSRQSNPMMRDLIDSAAAARRLMPDPVRIRVHEMRKYRNSIVHFNSASVPACQFPDSVRHLKAFLSYMPRQW